MYHISSYPCLRETKSVSTRNERIKLSQNQSSVNFVLHNTNRNIISSLRVSLLTRHLLKHLSVSNRRNVNHVWSLQLRGKFENVFDLNITFLLWPVYMWKWTISVLLWTHFVVFLTYPNSTTWPIFQQWYCINATYRVTAMYIATKFAQIQKLKYRCM